LRNNIIGDTSDVWIIERFSNSIFYSFYTPKGGSDNQAWFRVCPDDVKRNFNESKGVSYNLIFRLHGTRDDKMSRELYSFCHSRFVEFLLNNMSEEIRELSITTSMDDIKELDRLINYDW
jgi:hypothetical protein